MLLNNEVRIRSRKCLIQSRSFSEMLDASTRKYANRAIETAARKFDTFTRAPILLSSGAVPLTLPGAD